MQATCQYYGAASSSSVIALSVEDEGASDLASAHDSLAVSGDAQQPHLPSPTSAHGCRSGTLVLMIAPSHPRSFGADLVRRTAQHPNGSSVRVVMVGSGEGTLLLAGLYRPAPDLPGSDTVARGASSRAPDVESAGTVVVPISKDEHADLTSLPDLVAQLFLAGGANAVRAAGDAVREGGAPVMDAFHSALYSYRSAGTELAT